MLTEKANAICLLDVLKEYSDAEHILPMREIIAKMQSLYGIKIDRRTVYGAVALLIELGYDISLYEDNGVGYYLRSRELEQYKQFDAHRRMLEADDVDELTADVKRLKG